MQNPSELDGTIFNFTIMILLGDVCLLFSKIVQMLSGSELFLGSS